jgi:dethiobiotin synthetase
VTGGLFVTGTDTGVGKTRVAAGLILAGRRAGLRMAGMKPVASGCERTPHGLRNDDAQRLMACASVSAEYALVNPYAFEPPVAPHLAARQAGTLIDPGRILSSFRQLAGGADRVVVEGVGGWLVPIDAATTMADVAAALGLPVVLVVGIRLGCLNHALLTAEAIVRRGLPFAGWVANRVDPDCLLADANVESLSDSLGTGPLVDLPWSPDEHATVAADAFERAEIGSWI